MNLVLYGAGKNAINAMKDVDKYREAGYNVVCFCDKDPQKHGTNYLGFPVYSLEKALNEYDDISIFVTLAEEFKYEVFHELVVEFGVPREKILNYVETEKYLSCISLHKSIFVSEEIYFFCCEPSTTNGLQPTVERLENDSYDVSIDKLIQTREDIIKDIGQGKHGNCAGCPNLQELYFPKNTEYRKIENIAFSFQYPCQLSCSYCINRNPGNKVEKKYIDIQNSFNYEGFLEALEERNLVSETVKISMGSGEITRFPNKDAILSCFDKYPTTIYTNAILYDEKIAELSSRPGSDMIVSIDAGSKETYKLIKGLDVFERVFENIVRYVANGANVTVKYIFIPQNSNREDVDGFIEHCVQAGIKQIIISRDIICKDALPIEIIEKIAYMRKRAINYGMEVNYVVLGKADMELLKSMC